jgi:hypothetical protein
LCCVCLCFHVFGFNHVFFIFFQLGFDLMLETVLVEL